jgi:hypothetical protein
MEALRDLETSLAGVRHGLYHSCGRLLETALTSQRHAFRVADRLLRELPGDPAFQRRLAEILANHERSLPSLEGIIKSTYLVMLNINDAGRNSEHASRILNQVPWERERMDRLMRTGIAWFLNLARAGEPFRPHWGRRDSTTRMFGISFADPFEENEFLRFQGSYLFNHLRNYVFSYESGLTDLRGLRLALAAALYQSETGQPFSSFDDLVPKYFDRLPQSPLDDRAYHFFLADGGEYNAFDEKVVASEGQGLIAGIVNRNRDPRHNDYYFVPIFTKK